MLILVFTDFLHFIFYILRVIGHCFTLPYWKPFTFSVFCDARIKCNLLYMKVFLQSQFTFVHCYTTSLAWTILKIATSLSAYIHFNFPKNSYLYHDSWLMWEKFLRGRQLRHIAEIRVYAEVFPFNCLRYFCFNANKEIYLLMFRGRFPPIKRSRVTFTANGKQQTENLNL